jgi:hypothetical protein
MLFGKYLKRSVNEFLLGKKGKLVINHSDHRSNASDNFVEFDDWTIKSNGYQSLLSDRALSDLGNMIGQSTQTADHVRFEDKYHYREEDEEEEKEEQYASAHYSSRSSFYSVLENTRVYDDEF